MEAVRDGNHVPSALGVSTTSPNTTLNFQIDPVSGRLQVSQVMTVSALAPSTAPVAIGLFWLDTATAKLYVSTGTATSANWTILN